MPTVILGAVVVVILAGVVLWGGRIASASTKDRLAALRKMDGAVVQLGIGMSGAGMWCTGTLSLGLSPFGSDTVAMTDAAGRERSVPIGDIHFVIDPESGETIWRSSEW